MKRDVYVVSNTRLTENWFVSIDNGIRFLKPYGAAHPEQGSSKL